MSIFLNKDSKVIVQGMTGSEGTKHTTRMLASGHADRRWRQRPQGGTTVELNGSTQQVFGTVKEAVEATGANVSVVFVPPAFTKDAVVEAIDAAVPLVVVITEGVPGARHRRVLRPVRQAAGTPGSSGPNCPGVISPGESNAGHHPRPTSRGRAGSGWSRSPAR
jgi:succinyl-CoA synthetase alpha subunit